MESKPNYQSTAGKETNLKRFNLNQQTQVKQLINELNEKTKQRKQGESQDKTSLISKLITNDSGVESNSRKFGNNILNIDNSKNKSTSLINNRLNKLNSNDLSSKTVLNNGITKYDKLNGASDLKADNFDTTIKKVSSSLLNSSTTLSALTTATTGNQQTSSGKKVLNTAAAAIQETSPFECKPQLNQQQYNSSSKLSSSLSTKQLNSKVGSKKRSLKSFFKFSSSSKKAPSKSSSTTKSTNLKNLKLQNDLNLSRSSLTNQDCAVDSLIVDTFIDPAKLPQTSVTVSSESANAPKTKTSDSRSNPNETSVLFVQKSSSINQINNFDLNKLNNKTSTANNSPNHSHNNSQPSIKENSSTSSILPLSQSSFSSSPNSHLNNYSSTKPSKLASSNFNHTKSVSATENQKYQFDLAKKSFDSASSEHTVNNLSNHLSDLSVSDHLFTKTASSAATKLNQESPKIKKHTTGCFNCGDHLNQPNNLNYNFAKNSMSNGSNAAAVAIQMQQNADAYLSQLSAQQLNQLIMDQAFIPQNNTSNSTQSNSLSNHGNGTVFDSESSEQFKRLLCRKCRPNRTGIVQHSHNSGSKFARNLHNPRNGWSAIKDLSKGSIKRLKRHQKRLTSYARAMRKHHLNNSGSSGGGLTSGDLSDNVHQAAIANMVLNAMNTNKMNGLNYNNSSSNFCKECYLERILTHQNGGLINDYQQPNKNTTCLSCYNNLNNAFSMLNAPNYSDLPPPPLPPPLPSQKLSSSYKNDNFLDPIDRFWDVEQWRNKLHKERLRKKERNVLMVVSSIAIIVFIGISYFGTILFLRLTRLQNEEQ